LIRHNRIRDVFVKSTTGKPLLQMEFEPHVDRSSDLKADFSLLIGNSRYYYDVQIVAVSKESGKTDVFDTLKEAFDSKKRKYNTLGNYIRPLIFSSGGLMDPNSAKFYKEIQKIVGPYMTDWMDTHIGMTLHKFRAYAAVSITPIIPIQGRNTYLIE
jgi:hypothetical protein